MKIFVATLGGIAGAAQISTAYLIARPQDATDVMLTGAGGGHLLWSVPLGALIGVPLGGLLTDRRHRSGFWREGPKILLLATVLGFPVAIMTPGLFGLMPHSAAEKWRDLAVLSILSWGSVAAFGRGARHF